MQKPIDINQLVGQYLDLQDQWQASPGTFNWEALKAVASAGANFYNEGNGPSFQILAIDGMEHGEFHLRFLEDLLEAGFDPFKLVQLGSGHGVTPVFAHESLAYAAQQNPWSARMQACLHNVARARFGSNDVDNTTAAGIDFSHAIGCCGDSIPPDVIEMRSNALLAA